MKIVHISDLHLTSSAFVPEWGDKVVNMINSIEPEILGDIEFHSFDSLND